MNNKSMKPISDFGNVITGKTPPTSCPEDFGGSILFLTPPDFSQEKNLKKSARTVSDLGASKLQNKILQKDAVLVTCIGDIGNVAMTTKPTITNQQINSIVVDIDKYSPHYIYYLLKNSRRYLTNNAGQTVLAILGKTEFEKIELPVFTNKVTQQKIASTLSALDSKIELNNRINAELEAMAKTLYDYWFVQFDFPDKNGKPYKTSGGKMVWNEELKREIPEGWEVQKMAEWLDIDKSGDWGKEETEGNFTKQVICFRGADINGLNGLDELKPPVRWILEKNSFKILKSHDLIIEISGGSPTQSTGRLAFITDATIERFEHPLICSNFCKPVSMRNKKLLYNFVYYWNSLYDNGIFFGYEGKTSGIKNLLLDSFISSYYTVVPDEKIVEQFYNMMDNIQEKKQTTLAENQKLTELRDWLLPMLMNGQVKVN